MDAGTSTALPRLYVRDLPGGGYVAIDLLADTEPTRGTRCRAHVSVERRCHTARRDGHLPPVIAEAEGETRSEVFGDLYRIACDNVAVARGLMHWRQRHSSSGTEEVAIA